MKFGIMSERWNHKVSPNQDLFLIFRLYKSSTYGITGLLAQRTHNPDT
jgi:hypothetical protein